MANKDAAATMETDVLSKKKLKEQDDDEGGIGEGSISRTAEHKQKNSNKSSSSEEASSSSSSSPSSITPIVMTFLQKLWEVILSKSDYMNNNNNNSQQKHNYQRYVMWMKCFGVALAGVLLTKKPILIWIFRTLFRVIMQCVGITLGVGLGLGLAAHVYDLLTVFRERQQSDSSSSSSDLLTSTTTVGSSSSPTSGGSTAAGTGTGTGTGHPSEALTSSLRQRAQSQSSVQAGTVAGDEQTYASLMKSAGYYVPPSKIMRGQVLRHDDNFFKPNYDLSPLNILNQSKGYELLQNYWPVLPHVIHKPMAKLMELIMRDYIHSWYSMVDYGCVYKEVTRKDCQLSSTTGGGGGSSSGDGDDQDRKKRDEEKMNSHQQSPYPRAMIYSTANHLPIPFLERLYESMAIAFGNLATRVEHINVFELVLIKWTRILAHQFKVYRSLRKAVMLRMSAHNAQMQQQTAASISSGSSNASAAAAAAAATAHASTATDGFSRTTATPAPPKGFNLEMQVTKEFLFAGRLHRALTFGLDVPSLLFADGSGKECGRPGEGGKGNETNSDDTAVDDDKLLEERLFNTPLLAECELDYQRILSHRMIRALLPRHDVQSPLLSSLLTEMIAGCVLSPVLSCFCPEYMNSWVIKGLETKQGGEEGGVGGDYETGRDENGSGEGARDEDESLQQSNGTNKNTPLAVELLSLREGNEYSEQPPSLQSLEAVPEEEIAAALDGVTDISAAIKQQQQQQQQQNYQLPASSGNADTATPPTSPGPNNSRKTLSSANLSPPTSPSPPLSSQQHGGGANSYDDNTDIISLLTLALIELQQYVDFEDIRHRNVNVDWDDPGCRQAILRLVLVIEAALTHGRCTYKMPPRSKKKRDGTGEGEGGEKGEEEGSVEVVSDTEDVEGSEHSVEVTLPEYESATLSQILMEMTSDIEAFEERVANENTALAADADGLDISDEIKDSYAQDYNPTNTEQSTLRTLIASWLHTGQIYRTVTVLVQAHATILAPYYRSKAFLRDVVNSNGFVKILKALDGIEILVDTTTALASPRLDEITREEFNALARASMKPSSGVPSASATAPDPTPSTRDAGSPTSSFTSSQQYAMTTSASNPRYLDFCRNEAFASSLRSERERRMQSWEEISRGTDEEGLPIINRSKGFSEKDLSVHKELHHIARLFYSGTNLVAIRDAARHKTTSFDAGGASIISEASETADAVHVTLLTVETASQRRRIEIPDDDSSFLLRAQPRALNAVGVHRDQRNHENSFKCYAATYLEPALNANTEHYSGGRFIRRCLVRYYPIDRTASVSLQSSDARKLDQRIGRPSVPHTITVGQSSSKTPFLSSEFLRERHLCQRWVPKGTTRTQSLLASSVMEPTDFNSTPRTGKAFDFVYRSKFYEHPMIDLGGKHFTVQDQALLGTHRADASSLEISDATLSAALLIAGASREVERHDDASVATRNSFELGPDGYPIIWMKFKSQKEDDARVEVKPLRLSFVRAALLITAARHEAQLQSLIACVRSGSAKMATKALTDLRLKPTARLLEYAGNRSREKQSILLRDLKLGVNHIDRGQLRRNGLLSPRYPTALRELNATVVEALSASEIQGVDLFGATGTLYKVRCIAVADVVADDSELEGDPSYSARDGTIFRTVREEWVVYRSFKDFQLLHKHLKMQVSVSESSGSAGSRLVGAATAAFAAGSSIQGRSQQRGPLIPSLSQASKVGALGVTRKSIIKRIETFDAYLKYLLSPGHFLNRSSELLLFLGASFPLPAEVCPGPIFSSISDPLGRTEMFRAVVETRLENKFTSHEQEPTVVEAPEPTPAASQTQTKEAMAPNTPVMGKSTGTDEEPIDSRNKDYLIPAIQNKVAKVTLPLVRNRIFELLRYQFGFENAGFIRNRMLAALRTVSLAVTTNSEFQKTLYNIHEEQLGAKAVAEWIDFGIELLWPDGVFFQSSPPTPPEQLEADSRRAKKVLHESFPEAVRAVLGQDLTRDGLDIFHEMLQNRIVVKSFAYMLFDVLWLEAFPEIADVLDVDIDQAL